MAGSSRLNWLRVALAVIAAEALPILLLVLIVVAYGFLRQADSATAEEFAPVAGNWVGPIGGFVATLLFAWWAARHVPEVAVAHGMAVGVGTAVLDFGLGTLLGGGEAIKPLFFLSTGGRIVAGLLGGWLAARRGAT